MGKNIILIGCLILLTGCALFRWRGAEIYPMSYDQTYNMAISAMDDMKPWKLMSTDYANGVIVIGFEDLFIPEQKVSFVVKRIAPFRTKVQLTSEWPHPLNQKFFKAMDKRVENRILTYPS